MRVTDIFATRNPPWRLPVFSPSKRLPKIPGSPLFFHTVDPMALGAYKLLLNYLFRITQVPDPNGHVNIMF